MSRITMVRGYSPPPQDAAMDYAGYGASSPRPSYAPIPALNGFGRFGTVVDISPEQRVEAERAAVKAQAEYARRIAAGESPLTILASTASAKPVTGPFAVPATGYTSTGASAVATGRTSSTKPLLVLGGVGLFLWWMSGR